MDIRFDGKTIVVVGGSTGIGAAAVKGFVESGGSVFFTGMEPEEKINRSDYKDCEGAKCYYYQLDVTKEADVEQFAGYVKEKAGGCVNATGVFLCSKYFLPHMMEKKGGSIVNTSSMSGLFADYTFASYNASKAAVANLTRNMAMDYAKYHIRVNAVAPGSVKTSMYDKFGEGVGGMEILDKGHEEVYPMERIGKPEEIANAVQFLASGLASFITGHILVVDGGITAYTGSQHQWDRVREYYGKK